jgi:hypothetical protein
MPSFTSQDFIAIVQFEEKSEDRSAGIVGAAIVDGQLASAIASRFRPLSARVYERLLGDHGSISDFAIKADLGLALGLYGTETHDDVRTIIKIRNLFAHRKDVESFDDPEISALCDPLRLPGHDPGKQFSTVPPTTRKGRYLRTVQVICVGLLAEEATATAPNLYDGLP